MVPLWCRAHQRHYHGFVEPLFDFLGSYWWLVFPLSGVFAAWGSSWSRASERRHQRKLELYGLKHQGLAVEHARSGEIQRLLSAHDDVNRRWLAYELDAAKLIDYPMMTDVREPLTVAFLRAKREADALRPIDEDELPRDRLTEYRNAVNNFDVAFRVAESEAHRLKDTAFSGPERQRLTTARKLVTVAVDEAATPAERQTAYKRARRELDGLIVLPDATIASLEEKVARMLGAGSSTAQSRASSRATPAGP